jgi:hypothetical protein
MNSNFLYILLMGVSMVFSGEVIDTDKDGYSDQDELHAGTNPKDVSSLIYEGGWPYNREKDSLSTVGFGANCPGDITCECNQDSDCNNQNCERYPRGAYCSSKEGTQFPRFKMIDQFGEMVDIYDFSGQGNYILLELSAAWCTPCNQLSAWMTYGDPEVTYQPWWKSTYLQLKPWVDAGKFIMINIQYGDEYRDNASLASIQNWYSQYPHETVPVFADSEKLLHTWIKPTGIPTAILLNDKMEIVQPSSRGLNQAFDKLVQILTSEKK